MGRVVLAPSQKKFSQSREPTVGRQEVPLPLGFS